jgi:hypothetical protein
MHNNSKSAPVFLWRKFIKKSLVRYVLPTELASFFPSVRLNLLFRKERVRRECGYMDFCKITPVLQNAAFYSFIVTGALTLYSTIPQNKSIVLWAYCTFKTQDLEKITALEENINFTVQILIQKYHVALLLYSNLKRNL